MKVCMDMQQKGVSRDSISAAYAPMEDIQMSMEEVRENYVRENAAKDAAVLVLSEIRDVKVKADLLEAIAEPVRTGVMAPL